MEEAPLFNNNENIHQNTNDNFKNDNDFCIVKTNKITIENILLKDECTQTEPSELYTKENKEEKNVKAEEKQEEKKNDNIGGEKKEEKVEEKKEENEEENKELLNEEQIEGEEGEEKKRVYKRIIKGITYFFFDEVFFI